MKRRIIVLVASALLGACAIGYKSAMPGAGVSERRLAEDRFEITYSGNALNDVEESNFYVRARAAELAVQGGYPYFALQGSVERMRQSNTGYFAPAIFIPTTFDKPYGKVVAVFMRERIAQAFDAREVLEEAQRRGLALDRETEEKL